MIDKRCATVEEAVEGIADGATIMISGFQRAGSPERLLTHLADRGRPTGLSIVCNGSGAPTTPLGRMMAQGQVRHLVCSSVMSQSPFLEGWRAGRITLEVIPQGTLAERLRCAGAGLGGFLSPVGADTPIAEGREIRTIDGRDYILELPLPGDVALLYAEWGDRWGNLSFRNAQRNFGPAMAMAASLTVAEVGALAPLGEIDPERVTTPGIYVDRVVEVGRPRQ